MKTFVYKSVALLGLVTAVCDFHPVPRATYYLGDLSPDAKRLSFYGIYRDSNEWREGVVPETSTAIPKITWFDIPPDDSRLEQPPVWVSDDEFIYAIKNSPGMPSRKTFADNEGHVIGCCCKDCMPDDPGPAPVEVPTAASGMNAVS
jgi:hypothetical protein